MRRDVGASDPAHRALKWRAHLAFWSDRRPLGEWSPFRRRSAIGPGKSGPRQLDGERANRKMTPALIAPDFWGRTASDDSAGSRLRSLLLPPACRGSLAGD